MNWRHNRPLRIILLLFITIVVLTGVLPYLISFELIRTELSERLASDTHRTLDIRGRARLILLPRPALLLEDVSLSEPDKPQIFVKADQARIGLAFWPLLQREIRVQELEFDHPVLNVVRRADSSLNFEDLLKPGQSGQRLHFALDEMHFKNADLRFTDELLGNSLRLAGLNLDLSNLADPRNGKLAASGSIVIGERDKSVDWQGQLNANAAMRYNESEKRLLVADLVLSLQQQGSSPSKWRVSKGNLGVTGNLVYGWQPLRFTGGELKLGMEMARAEQNWKLDLDLPEIRIQETHLALNRLKLSASMQSPNGNFSTKIDVPSLAGGQQGLLRANSAKIEAKLTNPNQNLLLSFVSPLELHKEALIVLPGYHLNGSYGNRSLTRGVIPFDLQGEARLDLQQESFDLASQGTLDRSPLKTSVRVDDFVRPRYRVNLDLARLDLTPYLPAVAANAKQIDQDDPLNFWWLNRLEASGNVRIGELLMQKMHVSDLAFTLAASDHKLLLNPLSATVYEGHLTGSAEIDASHRIPSFHLQQRLSNMNINTLLEDAIATNRFEGRGSLDLDISAVGDNITHLRRTAGGNVQVSLSKGAIRGIDIEAVLRAASHQIKLINGEAPSEPPINLDARTHFSELKASMTLRHGVALNTDLAVTAGVLKLSGGGNIDLGEGSLDYTLKASANPKVAELSDIAGLTLPIQFSGSLAAPQYHADYAKLREQVEARKKSIEASKPVAKPANSAASGPQGKPAAVTPTAAKPTPGKHP